MSLIEVQDYKECKLRDLKKSFTQNTLAPNNNISMTPRKGEEILVKYHMQKIAVVIDLTPSMYSYHSGLKSVIYNQISPTISQLIKSFYSQDVNIELSIMCTRMGNQSLHVLVQSYQITPEDDYHDLLYSVKYDMRSLHKSIKLNKEDSRSVKFSAVLKWSLFTLGMMDQNRLPMVILITTTVDSYVSSAIYDGLVMQYCSNEVAFNIISVCSPGELRFGLTSDHFSLRDAAKVTGGHFIKAQNLRKYVNELFYRRLFKKKEHFEKMFIEEYFCDLTVNDILNCRLREGFNIWDKSENIVLGLNCGINTKIEYSFSPYEKTQKVKISLISHCDIYSKVIEKRKTTVVNIKDSEPAFHERITWIIENLRETDKFCLYLTRIIAKKEPKVEKLLNKNVNIWHRWMDVDRIDIVTSKSNIEFYLIQGRKRLNDSLKKFSPTFENDAFFEIWDNFLMIGKLIWEGVNKAVLFIGFFGGRLPEKFSYLFESLKKAPGIEVYSKSLGRMLVENISTTKTYNIVPIQSAQTYKPHVEALKAYILRKPISYHMLCKNWCQTLMTTIYESKVKKGFLFLGNCADNKLLLYKPYEMKESLENKLYFFQYLIYVADNQVKSEFYIDPELINKETVWEEFYKKCEGNDEIVYKSFFALEFLIYKCIARKLNEEDRKTDGRIVKLTTSDDVFCYLDSRDTSTSYKKLKSHFRKELVKVLYHYTCPPNEIPLITLLLKQSTVYSFEMETFIIPQFNKSQTLVYNKFYQNLITAYSEISDYSTTENNLQLYVRYLSQDSVLIWTLSTLEEVLITVNLLSSIPLNFYECSLGKLDPTSTAPVRGKLEANTSEKLIKNINLVKKIYKSAFDYTYCQVFDEIGCNLQCLYVVVNSCNVESKNVDASGLYHLIYKEWDDVSDLVSKLCLRSIQLEDESFRGMDEAFDIELRKSFTQIEKSNFYIINKKSEGIFLQYSKKSQKISHCLTSQSINFTLYHYSKSGFFSKEVHMLKKKTVVENNKILKQICDTTTSLISKQILCLLTKTRPITEKVLEEVKANLEKIPEKYESLYAFDLITPSQDYSDLIHYELGKNRVLYTKCVNGVYFLVGSGNEKNFFIAQDYEQEWCSLSDEVVVDDFDVDFWVLLKVVQKNSVKFTYFLPKNLEFGEFNEGTEKLNPNIVRRDLLNSLKKIEIRVNQRILLKNLLETGRISSMLLQAESDIPNMENSTNLVQDRIWLKKNDHSRRKPSLKPQGSYKLQRQHTKDFPVSDRLIKMDALGALSARFSNPPFSIDNIEDTYMLVQNQEVWLFKFLETNGVVTAAYPGNSKESKDKKFVEVKYIRLLVFGIDAPPDDTIQKLEKNVEELLHQASLARLADSLIKNQKKNLTSNDYQFIIGNPRPEIIVYPIPSIIKEYKTLISITKQNLLRFLSPFKIMDSVVLIYNYLNIIDTNVAKMSKTLLYKHHHHDTATYLGNTFGKALALISIDVVFFDGENLSENQQIDDLDDWEFSKNQIQSEILMLKSYRGMSTPSYAGHYLEVKIYKNGSLHWSIFQEQLDSCIGQSNFEYILEQVLTNTSIPSIQDRFLYISDCSSAAMSNLAQPGGHNEINHYVTWDNLFLFFSQIISIIEEQIDYKIKFRYGISINKKAVSSKSIKDIEEIWSTVKTEENIGVDLVFSAMADPEALSGLQNDELKFYLSEEMGEVYIKRSVFVYIEITSKTIRVFTYNLHRGILRKIQNAVGSHVMWARERFCLLNQCLMVKLGLYYHDFTIETKKKLVQENSLGLMLPQACCLLELNEQKKTHLRESLINPYETQHSDNNGEETVQTLKLKGSYPLLRYGMCKFTDSDAVKRHGLHMSAFLDRKSDHANEYEMCAYAYMKWAFKKNPSIDRVISKISKNVNVRDEIHLVKGVLRSSHLFFKENAKYHIHHIGNSKSTKVQLMLCEVLRIFTDRIAKLTKFDYPIQSELKNYRKNSLEDLDGSVKFVKTYYSSGALNNDIKVEVMQSYLKKTYDQALVVIEICYESETNMISTSGYCIENFFKCFPMYRWEDFKCNQVLVKELSRLKQSLDSVSSLYDIQVRCICNFLNSARDYPAINIVKTVESLGGDFQKPPRRCTNALYSFSFFINFGLNCNIQIQELFVFFLMNCKEFGYFSQYGNTKSQCAYKKMVELGEDSNKNKIAVKWCIFTQEPHKQNDTGEMPIHCYILKQDEMRKFRHESIKSIKQAAEQDFTKAIMECREYFRRDQLWNKIRENNSSFTIDDLKLLLEASKVVSMHDIDHRIKYLTSFKNVFTFNCLSYLTEVYAKENKIFEVNDKVHLVVIFSQKNLAHLILNREEQSLQMYSVSRSIGSSVKEEDEHITDMINKIIQWLWVRVCC